MAKFRINFIGFASVSFRLFLAAILILAALKKIPSPWSWALDPMMVETFSIFTFIPLDWIHWYVSFLPWLGGAVALVLILGFSIRISSVVAIVVLAVYVIANFLFLSVGIPCACMGENFMLVLHYAIAFDLVLLAMATWVFVRGDGRKLWAVISKKA